MPSRPSSDAARKPRRPYAARMSPQQRREQLIEAALGVIIEQGYEGVSIEAIARAAGVTRPVVYDHFPNLGRLLQALIEREERYALAQLEDILPEQPAQRDPAELMATSMRLFLDAVASRPSTWQIILSPPEGTPAVLHHHVETNRARTIGRMERLVRWAIERPELPADLDVELTARALLSLAEDAGRMVLTNPDRYSAERYERFARTIVSLLRRP